MESHPTDRILGASAVVDALRVQIRRLAAFDGAGNPHVPTVLIQGETGTGKGLVARVMHDGGPRARRAFVDVNCAAIPETMLEAELFGFEAGAFTDARRPKPGLFEAASGGTLFLDEIDALSIPLQSKLLKAIEEKSIRRLGAVDARQVDVKLIAATQADLRTRVAAGTFRADLYHRLAVVLLEVPPLRARGDDAVGIAERLLATYASAHGVPPKTLTTDGRRWLQRQPWPGNVRELGHLLERVTLLETATEVDAAMLERLCVPVAASSPAAAPPAEAPTSPDEEARIRSALARAGGNVVAAARLLGLGRNALRYRMRRYGIDRPTLSADAIDEPLPPPPVATPGEPVWETKAVSVLAVELTFAGAGDADSPWTAMRRWTSEIETSIRGFGGAVYVRAPTRLGAVFGVPLAVEQGPQRAVQAAAAIHRLAQDAGSTAPEVRTAVHLGSVHWDTSTAEPLQLLPVGSTLSAADLLLGHAAAGDILVTSQVARRLAGRSELRPLDVRLRFGAQEMQALRVVRQARPEEDDDVAEPASEAPYVGRERELAQLEDAFARAARGEGQVVFAVGEAGIGKSRLLAELRRRLAGTPHQWVQGHCTSYGSASAFLPIVDGLRRSFGIDDRDDEATATAKVDASIAAAGAEVAWTRPLVRRLLSLPSGDAGVDALDAASRRSETFRALRALALHAASEVPIVVVVEDLHWIDPASEEYLAFLAEAVPTTRVLLVCSHRPGYRHPFGDRSYHLRVSIQPLSADEMSAMAGWLLGAAQLPEALHQLITSKAEGNPFFVEEVTRSLVEQGVLRRDGDAVRLGADFGAVAVPDTIHEVLSARIDRLPAEARQAIQVAAVIGREFALRLLERIAEAPDAMRERVDELRALELVYQKALAPELAYMFKHALTHDVAYASVQPARRRALHRIIGISIEELYADRLQEHWETLAHHFSAAEDWTRALRYSELAAEKAEASHANRAVVEHCRHALAIAERTDVADVGASAERIVTLADRLGKACFYLSEYADSAVAHELAAARASDPETRALQLGNATMSHFWAHAYADAARTGGETLRLGRASGSASAEAVGLVLGGMASGIHDADVAAMERAGDEALAVLARAPSEPVEGTAKHALMMAAEWTGHYERAIGLAERVAEIGTRHHLLHMVVWPLWFEGKARCCLGQYGVALEKLQAAYDFCDRIGDRAWKSRMLNTIGWCLAEVGSHERARAMNLRAAALAHEFGDPEIIANSEINLALNALALGDPARADAYLAPIEATLARPGDPWMRWRYGLHVQDARARLLLAGGQPERALALAESEHAAARTHRVPKAEARALIVRGRALLATDRRDEARSALETATALADRIGYPRAVVDAQQVLAALARRTGDAEAAARAAARAADVGARLGATLADDDLRRTWNASLGR